MYAYKIATLNINGIANRTRICMLEDFLKKQAIDIAMLQEVTNTNIENLHGYTTHINIGTEMRGTALVVKTGIKLTQVRRLPTGRGISANINRTCFVNIYAPSGAERRKEREYFYNSELPPLLPTYGNDMILAGDFNCVLSRCDTTGQGNHSRALEQIICGYKLTDVWDMQAAKHGHTHYTGKGATRLDRIYVSRDILENKLGAETLAEAFTDHLAVALRDRKSVV
jgi:exonuclease III